MDELRGQQVVVVGAGSGIGRATAIRAANLGARVHLVSRSLGSLDEVATEIGNGASTSAADMTDEHDVRTALEGLDRIDHLAVTAVSGELDRVGAITTVTSDQVERSFDRIRGYTTLVRAAVPRLSNNGSITLLCGASAVRPPQRGFALLAAENASVTGFGRALALELAPIRVNVLMAGVVDTPIHKDNREDLRAWAERELPARRLAQPEDLAHAVTFLMTNPYATAQTFLVDGGITAI